MRGALGFAAWLTQHPAIGLASMLALTRSRKTSPPQSCDTLNAAERAKLSLLPSTCAERSVELRRFHTDTDNAAPLQPPACRPMHSNLCGLTTIRYFPARLRIATDRRQDVTQDEGAYDLSLDQDDWYARDLARARERELERERRLAEGNA